MSPEMLNMEDYDFKTDVYSFGIVLFYIFTGNLPHQSLKDKLNGKEIEFPLPSKTISQFCINLISKCLSNLPSIRPSFEDILKQIRENFYQLAEDIDSTVLKERDEYLQKFDDLN